MRVKEIDMPFNFRGSGDLERGTHAPHVTNIIRDLGVRLGILKDYSKPANNPGHGLSWDTGATQEVGFIWEDIIGELLGKRAGDRPPEMEIDGILLSPDGLMVRGGKRILTEYKATWKSLKTIEDEWHAGGGEKTWYYLTQAKSYLHAVGSDTVIFFILFLNGDYKPMRCCYRVYEIEFKPHEIAENWKMIVNHARAMGVIKSRKGK